MAAVVLLAFAFGVTLVLIMTFRPGINGAVACLITAMLLLPVAVYIKSRFWPQGDGAKVLCDWLSAL
jgi:hypothetical protein